MRKAGFFIFLLPLLVPAQVFAASSNVNVSTSGSSNVSVNSTSNGESTTCVNGNCTTSGGGSKSTVCVNGKCQESDGDMEVNDDSNGGNTQVHIKTSTGTNSVTQNGSSKVSTDVKVVSDNEKEASEEAKKVVKKIGETRKNILDQIKAFLKSLFHF